MLALSDAFDSAMQNYVIPKTSLFQTNSKSYRFYKYAAFVSRNFSKAAICGIF